MTSRKLQASECNLGRCQASVERTRVVVFGHGDFFRGDCIGPESVRFFSLLDAFVGYVSISPGDGSVPIQFGPVALSLMLAPVRPGGPSAYVPCRRAIKALGNIMVAFPMSAHVKDFVLYVPAALTVETKDLMLEPLPLGLFVIWVILKIGIVSSSD